MTYIELTRDQSLYLISYYTSNFQTSLLSWIHENMRSNTKVQYLPELATFKIGFEDERDAILFKMRWL